MMIDYRQINWALFIAIVSIVAVLFGSVVFWDWLIMGKNSEVARNIALVIGGILGAYAIYLAAVRTKVMQQGQISESFAKAAEQLSSGVMSVRILAILSLEKIAIEGDEKIRQDIIFTLCTYIREKRPVTDDKKIVEEDISYILWAISNINKNKPANCIITINLSGINLSCVHLTNRYLSRAYLSATNLSDASLVGTNLSNANLSRANLSKADFFGAQTPKELLDARPHLANLPPAILAGANLVEANLSEANLQLVDLGKADLSGANLAGAILSGAILSNVDLKGANLSMADLSKVKGLDTAKNLETVINPPQEILDEIERRKHGQKETL